MMMICIIAPFCHLRDQRQWQRFAVRQLQRTLAGLVRCQPIRKVKHRLFPRINADVILERREVKDIVLVPIGWHPPGNAFLHTRQHTADGVPDLPKVWLDGFRLRRDIVVNT